MENKSIVTQTVNLRDDMNVFNWLRTSDITGQIAETARAAVGTVITTLDPGMKEYIYSGGNINIVVVSDYPIYTSPIRDSFLTVFGRATVLPCRHEVPNASRVAFGFADAINEAKEKIIVLRKNTSSFAQNQVVLVVQSCLINMARVTETMNYGNAINTTNQTSSDTTFKVDEWFFSYAFVIDDPVLGVTLKNFSQLIPIDTELVTAYTQADDTQDESESSTSPEKVKTHFDDIMNKELKRSTFELDQKTDWIKYWTGLDDKCLVHHAVLPLAQEYKRKWTTNSVITP